MYLLYPITLLAAGVVGVSGQVGSIIPVLRGPLGALDRMKGWIGILACLIGLWGAFNLLTSLSAISVAPTAWMIGAGSVAVCVCLGLVLGLDLMARHAPAGAARALETADAARRRLNIIAIPLSYIAIGLGAWGLVSRFL